MRHARQVAQRMNTAVTVGRTATALDGNTCRFDGGTLRDCMNRLFVNEMLLIGAMRRNACFAVDPPCRGFGAAAPKFEPDETVELKQLPGAAKPARRRPPAFSEKPTAVRYIRNVYSLSHPLPRARPSRAHKATRRTR